MPPSPAAESRPVRVLFLAWGFSIHALRRILPFVEDPGFEVTVAATHDYRFENARNILLGGRNEALRPLPGDPYGTGVRLVHRMIRRWDPDTRIDDVDHWSADLETLRAAVRETKPDVVFLQTLLYPCYLAFLLPRSLPVVITFWNGDLTWWARSNGIERLAKKRIVRHGIRRARAITVNSGTARDACAAHGAPPGKVHLIRYPGVDLDRFARRDRQEARRSLGIDSGRVVLCPRGLGGYLNGDVIVEAVPEVVRRHPDTLFLFVSGVGLAEWERLLSRARELGVEGRLRHDGQIPWERMPLYYNASDAMVSISSNDSLPNCMLEAMACGTPAIIGDLPQLREWVEDGKNGFLVPPRDPGALSERIVEVLEAPAARIEAFALHSRRLVEREADGGKAVGQVKLLVRRLAGMA
jgi:glycosyltransferase involved in cell wall biosynthesis